MNTMTKRYTVSELDAMPTLSVGQTDNLKVDTGTERVWLSRLTVEDGMAFDCAITVERYQDGAWVTVEEYDGSGSWFIERDGERVAGPFASENAAFGALLRKVPYSVDHATTHEGWAITEISAQS